MAPRAKYNYYFVDLSVVVAVFNIVVVIIYNYCPIIMLHNSDLVKMKLCYRNREEIP